MSVSLEVRVYVCHAEVLHVSLIWVGVCQLPLAGGISTARLLVSCYIQWFLFLFVFFFGGGDLVLFTAMK